MAVTIGAALLKRLIADRANLPVDVAEKIMQAYDEVVVNLLENGAKVRILNNRGFLVLKQYAETKRRNPQTGRLIKVPAKRRVTYYESRKHK